MKESMIQEALALYDQRGNEAVKEINRNMVQWEYSNDVNELRKADKLFSRMTQKYGRSPEEILLEKEKRVKILHFLLWVRQYMLAQSSTEWEMWRDWIVTGDRVSKIAKKHDMLPDTARHLLLKITKRIRSVIPYYDMQYGSLEEYLKD